MPLIITSVVFPLTERSKLNTENNKELNYMYFYFIKIDAQADALLITK